MTKPKVENTLNSAQNQSRLSEFLLEDTFPEPSKLFLPSEVASANSLDVLVAVDTNALLLLYDLPPDNFKAISIVFKNLASERRIVLPARAAREFIRHRDRKISDTVKAIRDQISRINIPTSDALPYFAGMEAKNELDAAKEALKSAKNKYSSACDTLIDQMKSWRGTDPITKLYSEIFVASSIVDIDEDKENILSEWQWRLEQQIPPGYADQKKGDTGIGDFLIWKAILRIGAERKADLIFVTAERKSDWWVRSDGEPLYPRPELVDEYRRSSDGRSVRLVTLHELLSELKVAESIVEEVKEAENKPRRGASSRDLFAKLEALQSDRISSEEDAQYSSPPRARMASLSISPLGKVVLLKANPPFFFRVSGDEGGGLKIGSMRDCAPIATSSLPPQTPLDDVMVGGSGVVRAKENDVVVISQESGSILAARIIKFWIHPNGSGRLVIRYTIFQLGDRLWAP